MHGTPVPLSHTLTGPQDAPPVVFINGLGGSQAAFALQHRALGVDHRILTFDHRGLGGSPLPDEPVTMGTYAADLVALLDELGLDRADFVGLSFGGRVLMELLLGWPERVATAALCCTSAGGPDHVPGDPAAYAALQRVEALTEADWSEVLLPALFGSAFRARYPRRLRSMVTWRMRHPARPEGVRRQWEALARFDASARLEQVRTATLVLHGSDDRLSPLSNAEALADLIPGAELAVLDGVGHSPNVEDPEGFHAALRGFWRR